MKTVRIRIGKSGGGACYKRVAAQDTACKGIVLTSRWFWEEPPPGAPLYTLTHEGTGLSIIAGEVSRRKALAIARKLKRTGFSFTTKSKREHQRMWDKAKPEVKKAILKAVGRL